MLVIFFLAFFFFFSFWALLCLIASGHLDFVAYNIAHTLLAII